MTNRKNPREEGNNPFGRYQKHYLCTRIIFSFSSFSFYREIQAAEVQQLQGVYVEQELFDLNTMNLTTENNKHLNEKRSKIVRKKKA